MESSSQSDGRTKECVQVRNCTKNPTPRLEKVGISSKTLFLSRRISSSGSKYNCDPLGGHSVGVSEGGKYQSCRTNLGFFFGNIKIYFMQFLEWVIIT
jgi:hypothetical protein